MYGHRGYSYLLSYSNAVAATEILYSSFLFTNAADMALEMVILSISMSVRPHFLGVKSSIVQRHVS